LPQSVTENGDTRTAWPILVRRECPAAQHGSPKELEVARTHLPRLQLFRERASGVVDREGAKGRRVLSHAGLLSEMRKLRWRGAGIPEPTLTSDAHEEDDVGRIGERQ